MYLDTDLLKKWYYEERKRLEALPAFEREALLAFVNVKKRIATEVKWDLTSAETLVGKPYVTTHIKKMLFADNQAKQAVCSYIDGENEKERAGVQQEWEDALTGNRQKIPDDVRAYGDFFAQLEKVEKIETELKARGINPEEVYADMARKDEK